MMTGAERAGPSKQSAALGTWPLLWIVFIIVAGTSTLWPVLTPYAEDLGARGVWLGVVVGAIYATRLVLGPWIGRLADRYGYRWLLFAGTLLYIPIAFAYAGAGSVVTLAGARLLHGVGSAIVLPMVMAVMGQHAAGRSGAAMARFNAAQWLGYALGPIAGGIIVAQLGSRAVFLLLAPAGVLSALAVLLIDRRYTAPVASAPAQTRAAARFDLPSSALLGYYFIVAPASLVVLSFFPLLAASRGYGAVLTGALLSIASLATAVVQPAWGRVADHRGIRTLLLLGGLGTLVALVLLAAFASIPIVVAATLTAGVAIAALVAGTSTAAVDLGRTRGMGSYVGLFQSAGSLGQAVMPLLYGLVMGWVGVRGLLAAVGGLAAAGALGYTLATVLAPRRLVAASARLPE